MDLRQENCLSLKKKIKSRTHKGSRLHASSLVSMFRTAVVLQKNKKTLINTVQGLLFSVNGLDLDYWVQSWTISVYNLLAYVDFGGLTALQWQKRLPFLSFLICTQMHASLLLISLSSFIYLWVWLPYCVNLLFISFEKYTILRWPEQRSGKWNQINELISIEPTSGPPALFEIHVLNSYKT